MMQTISIHFDMDFRQDVYTWTMPDAISQLQMLYIAEEDRILFRVNSTGKNEFRFWVTRRYAMILAKVLRDHKQTDPDISSQVTQQAKVAVQDFKQEKAIGEAAFGQKFNEDGNDYPLGPEIQLAFKLSYKMPDNGTLQLSIQPKEGKGINIVLNQDINTTLTQLLMTAAGKGDWDLENSLKETPDMAPENIVIN